MAKKADFHLLSSVQCFFLIFLIFGRKVPENKAIYGKEGLIIVGFAWILWSLFGAFPFLISGCIPDYLDALFETVSGFTTTGSSILADIETLPKGMLFWRGLTNWIGGMGVLAFVMMLTSLDDENSMHLMRAEIPGPIAGKLVPKARSSAKILYAIYFILTAAQVVFLLLGGMNFYDALVHALSVAGTGGFSTKNASISHYNSAYIDGVVTVFMILFGINFNLYFLLRLKEWKVVLKNEELRVYLGIVFGSIMMIVLNILSIYGSILHSFRYAAFQVASVITTTGFYTANFELWPQFSKMLLLGLMMMGSCAGSTGGGMKVARFLILMKSIKQEIRQMLHPKSVTIVRINGKKVGREIVNNVYIYFICYVLILMISVLLVSINNFDFMTTFSAVISTLSSVGPGFVQVGPMENFNNFSWLSKLVLCFDMLVGRLEIFPYLLLVSPDLWRRRF